MQRIGSSPVQIDEFISGEPGRLHYEDTNEARAISTFKDCYGIGPKQAYRLVERGARTLDDLKTKDFGLTDGQKVSWEFSRAANPRLVLTCMMSLSNASLAKSAARSSTKSVLPRSPLSPSSGSRSWVATVVASLTLATSTFSSRATLPMASPMLASSSALCALCVNRALSPTT